MLGAAWLETVKTEQIVKKEINTKKLLKKKCGQSRVEALWRQKQADLWEIEASLGYKASSGTTRPIERDPVPTKQNRQCSLRD